MNEVFVSLGFKLTETCLCLLSAQTKDVLPPYCDDVKGNLYTEQASGVQPSAHSKSWRSYRLGKWCSKDSTCLASKKSWVPFPGPYKSAW